MGHKINKKFFKIQENLCLLCSKVRRVLGKIKRYFWFWENINKRSTQEQLKNLTHCVRVRPKKRVQKFVLLKYHIYLL